MALLENRGILLVEKEGTANQAETLVAADAVAVPTDKRVLSLKGTTIPIKVLRPDTIGLLPVQGGCYYEVSLETWLKGGGTAGTTHNLADIFQACGLKETDGASDVTYTPDLTDGKTATIGEYRALQLMKAYGVTFGEWSVSGKSNEPWMFKAKGKGLYTAVEDEAIISSPVLDTTSPIVFGVTGGSFSLNGYAFKIRAFELSVKIKQAELPSGLSAGYGYDAFPLTEYETALVKITAELPTVAAQDLAANWRSGDNAALDMTIGATAGNRYDIDMPRLCINSEPKYSEDGGISLVEVEYTASTSTDNALDDWLVFKSY